ncbi:hypothetical protein [Natrinema thermotolerans]
MGRSADAYNALRRRVLPGIHNVLDVMIGGYALSDTPPDEYVGTLCCSEPELEELLSSFGFTRNLVASLKVRVDGNVSDGSWVYRESFLADYQLHVILHQTESGVETYAHWEYSSVRHPYRHYLAREYDAEKGVRIMRSILAHTADSRGVPWTIEAPIRRHTWYISILRAVSGSLAHKVADVRERFVGGLTAETPGLAQRADSLLRCPLRRSA